MTDTQIIRCTLEDRLNGGTYTGITNSTDISWENIKFNPIDKDAWIKSRFVVTEQVPSIVGAGNAVLWRGLYLIDCYVKENTAVSALDVLADQVMSRFPYGTQLEESGKIINIRSTSRAGSIHDTPWYFVPVAVNWYAYI